MSLGLLIAAVCYVVPEYGVLPAQAQQSTLSDRGAGMRVARHERPHAETSPVGPFWQWLNAREAAISAISTVFLMVFTAALVVATIYLYKSGEHNVSATRKAAEAAKDSADVAKIAQRPWVSVKATIGPRGLFFDVNGANLDLIFSLKNTGNTPAITIRIEGGPRIDVKTNDRMMELEQICDQAKTGLASRRGLGYTIFPGDILQISMTYIFVDKQTLERVTAAQYGFILPMVIGCVDYLLTYGEPIHHQSRFAYDLRCLSPTGTALAIRAADGDKGTNSLTLIPGFEAGSFQAD